MKNTLKMGLTILVVAALTMSRIALAQTDDSSPDELGERPAVARIVEKLQGLIDDGTISESQAQAVAETLAEGLRPGGHRRHHAARLLGGVADFLGMEAEDFRAALQEYDTLAEIAEANGSSGDELVEHLVDRAEERITAAVENGRIEQATADERLSDLEERFTEIVNGEIPEFGGRPFGGGFGPGGPGAGGPIEDAGFSA